MDAKHGNVVVTGASGHIGRHLVHELHSRGHRVRAVVFDAGLGLGDVEVEHHDVRDIEQVRKALRGADTVFHLAGAISIHSSTDSHLVPVNVDGARNVAKVCLELGVGRLVHFSSVHALSPYPVGVPVDEQRPLVTKASAPAYDRSKAEGDRQIMAAISKGLNVVTVHPTGVIGPNDRAPSQMGTMLLDLYHGRLQGMLKGGFNWVDVRDVVTGTLAAAERGRSGDRYLLGGHWASIGELAAMTHALGGARPPRFTSPMWMAQTLAPLSAALVHRTGGKPRFTRESVHALRHHRYIDTSKATKELGFSARPLRETLADTFAWFDEAGITGSK